MSAPRFRVYRIGRSRGADIRINDASVSRVHAELALAADGACHLADCGGAGSYLEKDGRWEPLRQALIKPTDVLMLGRYRTTAGELLALAGQARGAGPAAAARGNAGGALADDRPEGPVRRDVETGDIIRGAGEEPQDG